MGGFGTRTEVGFGSSFRRAFKGIGLLLLAGLLGTYSAIGLTLEEARDQCGNTVGKSARLKCLGPMAFQKAAGGRGEECQAQVKAAVRECVQKTMKITPKATPARANVPVALPSDKPAEISLETRSLRPVFVAPPRTISDIAAILDSEKPDPNRVRQLATAADATPLASTARQDLAWFYYNRGYVRAQLGRLKDAIHDANKAIELGRGAVSALNMGIFQQFAGLLYSTAGNPKQALEIFHAQVREAERENDGTGAWGHSFGGYRQISGFLIQMGDIKQADIYLHRNLALIEKARTSGHPGWRKGYASFGQTFEADIDFHRALLFEVRGQFDKAEAAYRQAELRKQASIKELTALKNYPTSMVLHAVDDMILNQARMKTKLGQLAEAEADVRRALLARLKGGGKYGPTTPRFIMGLVDVIVEQGRYSEAERLSRVALDINRAIGVAEDSQNTAQILSTLGGTLALQEKFEEAAAVYVDLDRAVAQWEPPRRQTFDLSDSRIDSLYRSGQVEAGLAAAEALVKREISRVGERHFDTAAARGKLAVGYVRAGKDASALTEFRAAIPLLIVAARETADTDDSTLIVARRRRLQEIIESYIALLVRTQWPAGGKLAIETFHLTDAIRTQSVQQAFSAATARMAAKDPALAELIRKEQDLGKQINAQLGVLNNLLALPSSDRDDANARTIKATIDKARGDRKKAFDEIARRFPSYADLINPSPPTAEQIKESLGEGEAFLSYYFGRESSFVWAVPKKGAVAFARIAATAGDVEGKIRRLRQALAPQAIRTLNDIPQFDLALAHDLYRHLLEPVEAGWKEAKSLIVVTNGALGLLPLSLLPTAPTPVTERGDPWFDQYRSVPWLARTHAVTMVPSVAALRTLRQLPAGTAKREPLIGFGDPYFSAEQVAENEGQQPRRPLLEVAALPDRRMQPARRAVVETRQIDTADLARLPRLPDTADELRSIALSLHVDPAKALHLGKDANERVVKGTDLSRFRIIAFATHGLMPGDLNGLTQPALALSAPTVADVDGDGLLTMEEVLGLKVDADWVVLSACNTGTGAEAGAEAVSGLGRAFFYAGTRALLVTNWAVMSDAATALPTDIFLRQAADPTLARAEALRQAMLGLIDGPGYVYAGKTVYSYAHPIFWAPYAIIGDGGAR